MVEKKRLFKKQKESEVKKLEKMIDEYSTIGILDMHKFPAGQLIKIKKNLNAKIKMSGKNLIIKALKTCGKNELADVVEKMPKFASPAIILSNDDPFKLFRDIKKNRANAPAKVGDVVATDVIIKKGPTNLPPGPAITTLQKVGLKTRVEGGKIAIVDDKLVLKVGGAVNEDLVNVFNLLKIEPVEIALNLLAAYDGTLYVKEILDVDVEKYITELQNAVQDAINLSINVNYPTKLTIERILQKAFNEAKNLCMQANIFEKEVIGNILAKAVAEAKILVGKLGI